MSSPDPHQNRRILIIDDNRSIHDDFRKILCPAETARPDLSLTETMLFGKPPMNDESDEEQQIHYEIDSAYQGAEGVMLVKKALEEGRPYAMAFVDMRMPPGWDGIKTTQKIWEIDSEIQIVICTAYAAHTWSEIFEQTGNNDRMVILKKPFDTAEVLQLAREFTEKWSSLHVGSKKQPAQSDKNKKSGE